MCNAVATRKRQAGVRYRAHWMFRGIYVSASGQAFWGIMFCSGAFMFVSGQAFWGIMFCSGAFMFYVSGLGHYVLGQGIVRNAPAQNLMPLYFCHFGAYTLFMRAFGALFCVQGHSCFISGTSTVIGEY